MTAPLLPHARKVRGANAFIAQMRRQDGSTRDISGCHRPNRDEAIEEAKEWIARATATTFKPVTMSS